MKNYLCNNCMYYVHMWKWDIHVLCSYLLMCAWQEVRFISVICIDVCMEEEGLYVLLY